MEISFTAENIFILRSGKHHKNFIHIRQSYLSLLRSAAYRILFITDKTHTKLGMVIDFGDLKKIVKEEIEDVFDHATVFNKNTPHLELANELKTRGHNVILVDYQPTSENMVIDFAKKIKTRLPKGISLHSLKLKETETSYAEWFASDNV